MTGDADFEWVTTWVAQNVHAATITFAQGVSAASMFRSLGADPTTLKVETFAEADNDPEVFKARVGQHDGWTYAVEHFTARGVDGAALQALSADGGEAFSLSYTPTIDAFAYASDGKLVYMFNMGLPNHPHGGSEPQRFDADLAAVGFGTSPPAGPAAGARLVQRLFGLTLDQNMLERPLAAATVPPPWARR